RWTCRRATSSRRGKRRPAAASKVARVTTRSRSDVHREEGQSSSRALALFVWGLVTGALACGACASSPRVPAAPAREAPAAPSDDVDDALRGELVPLTRALLRTGALGESGPREAL